MYNEEERGGRDNEGEGRGRYRIEGRKEEGRELKILRVEKGSQGEGRNGKGLEGKCKEKKIRKETDVIAS